jgi:hypothetical protein
MQVKFRHFYFRKIPRFVVFRRCKILQNTGTHNNLERIVQNFANGKTLSPPTIIWFMAKLYLQRTINSVKHFAKDLKRVYASGPRRYLALKKKRGEKEFLVLSLDKEWQLENCQDSELTKGTD